MVYLVVSQSGDLPVIPDLLIPEESTAVDDLPKDDPIAASDLPVN